MILSIQLENIKKQLFRYIEREEYLDAPGVFFYVIFVVLVAYLVAKLFELVFDFFISYRKITLGRDTTTSQFIKHFLKSFVVLIGIMYSIYSVPSLNSYSKSILAGAGLLAVAIGFASQAALSNIISGIFIVIFKPFRVKDHLTLMEQDIFGIVDDITLRHTILTTPENRKVVIPNSLINNQIIKNSSFGDPSIYKNIEVLVAYDTDLDMSISLMNEIIANHPLCIDRRTQEEIDKNEPKVLIKTLRLEENGVRLRAWAWAANNNDAFSMTCDVNKKIVENFRAAGIEIPVPQRVILHKNKF